MIKLIQGDCLEKMKDIPDESVDMVLTDPPYGMNYKSNRRTVLDKFDKIKSDDCLSWLDDFCAGIFRVMKDNSAAYVFCSWHNVDLFKIALERRFKIKNLLVWVKNNHGSGDLKGAYAPKHEFIFFVHKGRCIFRNGRRPDVIECAKVPSSQLVHPTEKPVDMLENFIRDASDLGDNILDPFMGSGTTGIAVKNLNRNFIGIELDPEYFAIAKRRIQESLF